MFYDSEYFSEGPGYFPGACGVLRVCWWFTTPGQIPLYPGWVICAIWNNGSEFEPCMFDLWIWHIQQMKKCDVILDNDGERAYGDVFDSWLFWFNLGI